MSSLANLFLQPDHPLHRQYEALRAIHVEGLSAEEAAKRFGYHKGSLYNLAAKFRKDPSIHFSREVRPGPKPKAKKPRALRRTERIVELRKQENLSAREIQERLATEGIPAGISTFARTVKQAGLPRLWRRTNKEREERRARRAPAADGRKLNLQRRSFETRFGGLFLFAFDLARLEMESMLKEHAMPGSDRLPAGCAFRALLALKLWGIGRPHHIMPDVLDEGLALFAGLNVIPKRSTLSEYSCAPFAGTHGQLASPGLGTRQGPRKRHLLQIWTSTPFPITETGRWWKSTTSPGVAGASGVSWPFWPSTRMPGGLPTPMSGSARIPRMPRSCTL